ncbi:MAG: DUF4340 domain-containing protein [Planctomycetota bacterium]
MSETGKTAIFVVLAGALGGAAYLSRPTQPKLEYFDDQSETFYPEFTDPLAAAALEVVEFDEASGTAKPFKVELKDGVWSIPSHHNYPADGKDRLAKTAAGLIELRKDTVQSDRAQDHEALGVIDPLDDSTAALKGRGQRVTLRDAAGRGLADFIIGKPAEGKTGFRYVRLPDKKRVYGVKMDVDISTRFTDWIETNLLALALADLRSVEIDDYSIEEATGQVDVRDTVGLEKSADNKWTMQGLPAGKELDASKVNQMASALSRITITGVRVKPEWLAHSLQAKEEFKADPFAQMALQQKGFFIARDGRLLSNEGEVRVGTKDAVRYTLRFGEVLFGDGLDVSAGTEEQTAPGAEGMEKKPEAGAENRYLFVTAAFDESLLPPKPTPPEGYQPTPAGDAPSAPAEDEPTAGARTEAQRYEAALKEWTDKAAAGRKRAGELNQYFAPWYYVISGADFKSIRLDREKLIKAASASD